MNFAIIRRATLLLSTLILGECEMPFSDNYHANGCNCISYCSCDCNHINCSVFMG